MPELQPLPSHSEVSTIEFEPDLTDAERVAVVCMFVLKEKIADIPEENLAPLREDILDIAACEALEEALGTMPTLEDYVEGDLDCLFEAMVVAGLIEGVRSGGDRKRSVILGRNLLQLPSTS